MIKSLVSLFIMGRNMRKGLRFRRDRKSESGWPATEVLSSQSAAQHVIFQTGGGPEQGTEVGDECAELIARPPSSRQRLLLGLHKEPPQTLSSTTLLCYPMSAGLLGFS